MSSPPSSETTTSTSSPWAGQQGALLNVFNDANTLYQNKTPQYFPQSTVSTLTPEQIAQGYQQYQYGMDGGNQALQDANSSNAQISSGYYMNNQNPDLKNVEQQALAQTQPQTAAAFINGGGMNGGLAAQAVAQGDANAVGQIGYQNYNDQIQNMQRANLTAPSLDQAQATDLSQAGNYGNMLQNQNQAQLTNQVNEWNYNQNLPFNMLGMYDNFIQGNYGGTTTQTTPYYSNGAANALSEGLGGLGIAQALPSAVNGIGSAFSGITSLLSGLF